MKYQNPNPDTPSDESIRGALASNGIQGYPSLDADAKTVPFKERVEPLREFLRIERLKITRNHSAA